MFVFSGVIRLWLNWRRLHPTGCGGVLAILDAVEAARGVAGPRHAKSHWVREQRTRPRVASDSELWRAGADFPLARILVVAHLPPTLILQEMGASGAFFFQKSVIFLLLASRLQTHSTLCLPPPPLCPFSCAVRSFFSQRFTTLSFRQMSNEDELFQHHPTDLSRCAILHTGGSLRLRAFDSEPHHRRKMLPLHERYLQASSLAERPPLPLSSHQDHYRHPGTADVVTPRACATPAPAPADPDSPRPRSPVQVVPRPPPRPPDLNLMRIPLRKKAAVQHGADRYGMWRRKRRHVTDGPFFKPFDLSYQHPTNRPVVVPVNPALELDIQTQIRTVRSRCADAFDSIVDGAETRPPKRTPSPTPLFVWKLKQFLAHQPRTQS